MREVIRCSLHRDCDRLWTARCRECKVICRGCGEDKPCSDFARDKHFLRAYCKECERFRTKRHRDDAMASKIEGETLAELLFLHMFEKLGRELGWPCVPNTSDVKRRWNLSSRLTGVSIAHHLQLTLEEARAWPERYRDMVLQATGRKEVVHPAGMNVHFEFECNEALPEISIQYKEFCDLLKRHMDPDNLSVKKL